MRSLFLCSVATFIAFVVAPTAEADLIPVSTALASSDNGGSAIATVNGAGLGSQYPAFPTTHSGANVDGWVGHGSVTDPMPWVHYDFGVTSELGGVRFWDYNATANQNRGLLELDIFYSNVAAAFGDDNHSSWVLLNSLTGIARGATANGGTVNTPFGAEYDLANANARYIRFDIVSTWGEQPAFGEVQFLSVPEPGTSLLLVGLGASLILRRRFARCF